jgi:hypothetical protein
VEVDLRRWRGRDKRGGVKVGPPEVDELRRDEEGTVSCGESEWGDRCNEGRE